MTAIAMRGETALDLPVSAPPASDKYTRLMQWAEAATAAHRMAQMLVRTSFVPEAFRGKPEEAAAAILAGLEVGLEPMAALRSFDIIQGTAAPRALTQRAVVQSHGHRMWEVETTATRAIVKGQRRGESDVHTSTWTLDRAKGLGLLGKKNWQDQPQAMLLARATAECARMTAADALLGIPYAVEELDDGDSVTPTVADEVKPARRTAQRRQTEPQPAPEPDLPEPTAPTEAEIVDEQPTEPDEPTADMITDKQLTKLHATLGDLGWNDRAKGLAEISEIVGEPLTSSKQLTKVEAIRVIDVLETKVQERRRAAQEQPQADTVSVDLNAVPGGQ
jgi:hypothetical protein